MDSVGLRNEGERNCFINSIVQVLYNDLGVRRFVCEHIMSHRCLANCLICALQVLFM